MPQIGLDANPRRQGSGNAHNPNVGRSVQSSVRPRVVILESGIKALVEVVGLADVDARPDAVLVPTEDIDAADSVER